MIGLAVLGFLLMWFLAAVVLALGATRLVPPGWWRLPFGLGVFVSLSALPVADEISGGREFAALCKANSAIDIDPARAAGRRVYEAPADFTEVEGTRLTVHMRPSDFIDAESGERVLGFRTFTARGGGLSEALRFSESSPPLTFNGRCNPGEKGRLAALFKQYRITLIRRP